jgi:hypothetical protein
MQGLMMSAALWFGWKNRDAIERSVRAAREAWNETGATPSRGATAPSATRPASSPTSSSAPSETRRVDVG